MDNVDELFDQVLTAYVAQMDSAVKVSEILCEHSGEKEISPDNIVIGLIYRLMVPMSEEELQSSFETAKKIMDPQTESDEEFDSDEELEEGLLYDEPENKYRYVKKPICNCDICSQARVCLLNYPNYESYDKLTGIFHNAIKETCSKYKLWD